MRFRCNNNRCGLPPKGFEFESDLPHCPKCGTQGGFMVHQLADVHFLVVGHGPMMGLRGAFHVACEPDRPHLALYPNDGYAASDLPSAVTCPRCRGTKVFLDFVRQLFPDVWSEIQRANNGRPATVDLKQGQDCGCGN